MSWNLKFGQNTGYLAYVLMAKSNLTKTYKMNILTICNTSDKVVCNFLTNWARDPKIGQNTGYLAYVLMAKSNLTKTYKMNILTICNISDKVELRSYILLYLKYCILWGCSFCMF